MPNRNSSMLVIKPRTGEFNIEMRVGFDYKSAEYAELFASSNSTVFQSPLWLNHFATTLCPARQASSFTVLAYSSGGELIAALPMISRQFAGATLIEAADLGVCDYCAPVINKNYSDYATIGKLMASVLPNHDVLRLRNIRPEYVVFFENFSRAKAKLADFSAHSTVLETTFELWKDRALSANFKKTLARKVRKSSLIEGFKIGRLDEPGDAENAVYELARLRNGRFDGDMIVKPEVAEFYASIAKDGVRSGFSKTYVASLNGSIIGVLFGTCDQDAFHYLLIGCDYSQFGHLSPGMVLYDFAINDWIVSGGHVFDFTIGDEPFKADFGTKATPMSEIQVAKSLKGQIAILARDLRQKFRKKSP